MQQHGFLAIRGSKGAAKEIVEDGVDGFAVDPKEISLRADRLDPLLSQPKPAPAIGEIGRRSR